MHISPEITFPSDPHRVVQDPDFSGLEALYAGRFPCYGDYHGHSASGGTSDGETTPTEWLQKLQDFEMDFVGLMDHKQVRHMYLPEFDPAHFLYGTEPAGRWLEDGTPFHYLMIVPKPECLLRVLEAFPEVYEFTGGTEGHFRYIRTPRAVWKEVMAMVEAEGGAVVHPHPKQVMDKEDPADYAFGGHPIIETIYVFDKPGLNNPDTVANYKLWMQMLQKGLKVTNTASQDCHGKPTNQVMNTVYTHRRHNSAYLEYLRKGDLTAGFMGIKMSIGTTPMGGTAPYIPGSTLCIEVNDAHRQNFDANDAYRLDVLSDQGLAWSGNIPLPFRLALSVEDRKFYRAVVIRESDGAPAAIGNPIWITR